MHIRIRLMLMKEIEHRNEERIKAYENQRKGPSKTRKKKARGNRGKAKN